jgi:ribosomal protein S18 acetylase RimI-like enzyme
MPESKLVISELRIEDLRADHTGAVIEQIARIAQDAFREPPWQDDHQLARLHVGIAVDLMRRNALAFLARDADSGEVGGYSAGYEVVGSSDDPRDIALAGLCGSDSLGYLLAGGGRVFYWDTLCVAPAYRRRHAAQELARAALARLPAAGFSHCLVRTDLAAMPMRGLLAKLGFEELPVRDARHITRTYWTLPL